MLADRRCEWPVVDLRYSDRYAAANPWRHLKTRTAVLNLILCRTGSQWNSHITTVMSIFCSSDQTSCSVLDWLQLIQQPTRDTNKKLVIWDSSFCNRRWTVHDVRQCTFKSLLQSRIHIQKYHSSCGLTLSLGYTCRSLVCKLVDSFGCVEKSSSNSMKNSRLGSTAFTSSQLSG